MSGLFKVSSNPHIRSRVATNGLMAAVVIALMPAAGFGIYNFGPRALAVYAVTIASTLLTEYFFGLYKKKQTITDMSAVVTGLLLALNLPVTIPLWMAALGGVFAIEQSGNNGAVPYKLAEHDVPPLAACREPFEGRWGYLYFH